MQCVLVLTIMLPDINTVLSLITGSICGSLLFILPVFFYRAAYFTRPSKKDRTMKLYMGYALVVVVIPIGIMGVI